MGRTQFLEMTDRSLQGGFRFDEVRKLSKQLALLSMRKDIGGKEDGWLDVACDEHHLADWNGLPERIVVAALMEYRDVFDDPHVVTWGWFMEKLKVTTVLNHFSVELLLAPRFPSDVTITPAENIVEYNPQAPQPDN